MTAADPTITQVSGLKYKIKTATPHFRRPGNNVAIGGVFVSAVGTANAFNGVFKVEPDGLTPTELRFTLAGNPQGPIDWVNSKIVVGAGHWGLSADGGTAAVVEGNRVHNCLAAFYHDTWSTRDLVIRNNHFYNVRVGVMQNMGGFSYSNYATQMPFNGQASTTQQRNPTRGGPDNKTATFRTTWEHKFLPEQAVQITNVKVNGQLGNPFNVLRPTAPVSGNPMAFSYVMDSAPAADGDISNPPDFPRFSALWQVRRLLVENNLIEITRHWHPLNYAWPMGIYLESGDHSPDNVYTFRQSVLRGNVIRHPDNTVDLPIFPANIPIGILLHNCEHTLIEGNIIELRPYREILFEVSSKIVQCFDNNKPSGELVRGFNESTNRLSDELATLIEDAMLLALIERNHQI